MGFSSERAALENFMISAWSTAGNPCPLLFENSNFPEPTGVTWARFVIRPASTSLASIGSPTKYHKRTHGVVMLQIFVPESAGSDVGLVLADTFAAAFDLQTITLSDGVIRFYASCADREKDAASPMRDTGFFMINVNLPYMRDSMT